MDGGAGQGRLFRISTMDCGAEEAEIRRALEPLQGIRSLSFQLGARTLRIDAAEHAYPLALEAIREAGFDPRPMTEAAHATGDGQAGAGGHRQGLAQGVTWLVAALVLALGAEMVSFFAPDAAAWKVVGMATAALAIWMAGIDTYRKGIAALARGRLNINALMSVAVTGAFLIGQWPEAAMVMALYAIAERIEAKAVDRARNAIQSLLELAPEEATVLAPDRTWSAAPVATVAIGATVRIRPGERVPLDGVVTRGHGAINQAPVTGESIPVDKAPGDPVFAGTINETGELEFEVTASSGNTTLARIIHAVEAAQGTRAPTQRFVDRFAAIYTPSVFAVAVAVAALMPLLTAATWLEALYKALVLLVIACPCALVISTPVTVVSGLAAGARRGILIKGGTYLENARHLKAVALDKTGTLTEGRPRLAQWRVWGDGDEAEVARMAASLAARSDHPVSRAIVQGLDVQAPEADRFRALPGRGVEGVVGGARLVLGNHRLIHEKGLCDPALEKELASHETQGRTVTLMADGARVLAVFAVADTLRETSRQAVADLKALGVTPVMLSGDNTATARAIAAQAGIDDARGDLLPEAKLDAIEALRKRHGPIGMAGDGINDAPALARANVGVAMGTGTDVAMNSAQVTLVKGDLRGIAVARMISDETVANMKQNLGFAFIYNALGIPLAAGVLFPFTGWLLSPMIAALAMSLSSVSVIGNALRLRGAGLSPNVASTLKRNH